MTENLSPAAIDALLSQTRRAFENLRRSQGEPSEQARGEGTALDERVRAVVVAPGRVEELTMDPRVLREGSEAVCEAIAEAVNAALDDLRSKVMEGNQTKPPDPSRKADP